MYFISIIIVYVCLLITACVLLKKISFKLYWKLTFLYLLALISFRIEYFYIPVGLIIGLFVVKKIKKDLPIMKLTLIFSLIVYIFSNYLIPKMPVNNLLETINTYELINHFEEVESIKSFSPSETIQVKLKQFLDDETDQNYFMLIAYILMDNQIELKDNNWLLTTPHDYNITGKRMSKTKNRDIIQLSYNGQDYIGIFDISKKEPILNLVIKGKIN